MRTRAVVVTDAQDAYLVRQARRYKASVSWYVRRMIDREMAGLIVPSDIESPDSDGDDIADGYGTGE